MSLDYTAEHRLLAEVLSERARQDAKFGNQDVPDGTGGEAATGLAAYYRDRCDRAAKAGSVTWTNILLEEVYEALAESDPGRLREELLQVAAVCTSWAGSIDRRGKK